MCYKSLEWEGLLGSCDGVMKLHSHMTDGMTEDRRFDWRLALDKLERAEGRRVKSRRELRGAGVGGSAETQKKMQEAVRTLARVV